MADSGVEVPETPAAVEIARPQPKQSRTTSRAADKRAESLLAKKKKKRAAHRVALRRSNTGG
jgi:hypothetical protein